MTELSWRATKEFVYSRAAGCCEYCKTYDMNTGQTMHVDHIHPDKGNFLENLCLACPNCNLSKASFTTANDPETGQEVPLFNPRQEDWKEHFEWIENHTLIRGVTSVGRATVERLQMNRPRIILARQRWVDAGLHPVESS